MNQYTSSAIGFSVFFIGLFTWLSIWSYTAYTNKPTATETLYKTYETCRNFKNTSDLEKCEIILTHVKE